MRNTKFIMQNGDEIYPGYLDKENRSKLRNQYKDMRGYMRCGCKPDGDLFYRLSEDCKIYPEHNNYEHDKLCCRYKSGNDERQSAYVVNDEDGEVTAFLTFDPKSFSISDAIGLEKEQDNDVPEELNVDNLDEITVEADENQTRTAEKKEPKLSLPELIRSINTDTFTEKILNNRNVDSRETFSKNVYYRMKRVKISRMKKALGDLTLEKDGVRFFYLPLVEVVENTTSEVKKCYIKTLAPDGKVYSNYIFPKTMEKVIKEFTKTYHMSPDKNTMVAGFQYLKNGKGKSSYRVMGRVHLFQASNIGIYCRSLIELDAFDQLSDIIKEDSNIRFWVPPEDPEVGAIIEVSGSQKKILLLFPQKKDERILFDTNVYVPYVVGQDELISKDIIYTLLDI